MILNSFASGDDTDEEDRALQEEIESIRVQIRNQLSTVDEGDQGDWWKGHSASAIDQNKIPKHVRTLKGHFGKVYALHWAGDSKHMVSASQDGKLIIWNTHSTNKVQAIPLQSSWVMTCAYETSEDRLVACGGLDNVCSVYRLSSEGGINAAKAAHELHEHEGYISCCRFLGMNQVISASGDGDCILWDLVEGKRLQKFQDHDGDVMSLAVTPHNPSIFVSGSTDMTARIWDLRTSRCELLFEGHESDINSVAFFPTGNALGTGSDDASCKIFDLRACREIGSYFSENVVCGITSVDFSGSGRMMFAGYDDYSAFGWDVTTPGEAKPFRIAKHEKRVSCLQVNPAKNCLATGSWDTQLKLW